jgi:hypothetical protein
LQGRKKRQSSTGVSFPNIFPTTDEFQQAEQSAIEESLIPNQKELMVKESENSDAKILFVYCEMNDASNVSVDSHLFSPSIFQ